MSDEADAEAREDPEARKEKKSRKKVRSAWIGFVGRIVAQVIGAAATVVLGLLIAHQINRPGPDRAATPPIEAPVRTSSQAVWLAVLPLDNFSGDPAQEYLADGMTEALIADLARSPSLHVISRTSVMPYRRAGKTVRQIARELGVDAVIEGSVVRVGERVRITAQLVDAREDRHLWAASYDRDLRDVLAVQRDVARRAAREIEARLAAPAALVPGHVRPVEGDGPGAAAVARAFPELADASAR